MTNDQYSTEYHLPVLVVCISMRSRYLVELVSRWTLSSPSQKLVPIEPKPFLYSNHERPQLNDGLTWVRCCKVIHPNTDIVVTINSLATVSSIGTLRARKSVNCGNRWGAAGTWMIHWYNWFACVGAVLWIYCICDNSWRLRTILMHSPYLYDLLKWQNRSSN